MAANRFFISGSDIDGDRVRLSREQAHQISHVLRLQAGDAIVVLDGSGVEYDVSLTAVRPSEAMGQITDRRPARGEPTARITLFQSLLQREKFEWVLQKGTEVGVTEFVPVQTDRSLLRAKVIEEKRLDRWRRILTEAAEQSHRGRIPTLESAIAFHEAVARLTGYGRSIIAAPFDKAATLHNALQDIAVSPPSIAVMIGPEGGFTDEEVALACDKNAVRVGLGPRILRTETAAIVTCALVLHELGDL